MRTAFTGVGTALVTPFTKNGDLDEAAVRRLGRRQIDAGIHFLVPCGTTGESPTLSPADPIAVVPPVTVWKVPPAVASKVELVTAIPVPTVAPEITFESKPVIVSAAPALPSMKRPVPPEETVFVLASI